MLHRNVQNIKHLRTNVSPPKKEEGDHPSDQSECYGSSAEMKLLTTVTTITTGEERCIVGDRRSGWDGWIVDHTGGGNQSEPQIKGQCVCVCV